MSPSRSREVRVTKRVLLTLYLVLVLFLCVATTVGIVGTLSRADQPADTSGPTIGTGPDAQALAALRRLLGELGQRVTTLTRANPRKLVNVETWEAWKRGWRERYVRLGERYRLQTPEASVTPAGRALQDAFRAMGRLLARYHGAIKGLAQARRQALVDVDQHLSRAAKALRAGKSSP